MKFTSSRAVSGVTTGLTVALIILASSLAFLAYTTSNKAPVKPVSPVLSPMTQIQGQLVLNGNKSSGVLNFYNTGNVALAAGSSNVAFTTSGSCSSVSSPAVPAGSSASVSFSCVGIMPGATVKVIAALDYVNSATITDTVNVINTFGLPTPVFNPKISMQGQFFMMNFNGSANFGILNFYNSGQVPLPASQTSNVVFTPPSGATCASIKSPAVAPQSSAPAEFSCTNVLPGAVITVTATLMFANSATSTVIIDVQAL